MKLLNHGISRWFAANALGLVAGGFLSGLAAADEALPGDLLWTFDPEFPATSSDFFSEPAIGPDGTIYVGYIPSQRANSGTFFAINPDGTERWRETFTFPAYSIDPAGGTSSFQATTVGPDGSVYFGCGGHQYSYSPDGNLNWKRRFTATDPRIRTAYLSPVAISNEGRLYLPQGDRALMELDPETGETIWEFISNEQFRFSFARYASLTFNGDIFFTAWDNDLFSVSADGDVRFRYYSGHRLGYPSGADPLSLSTDGRIIGPQGDSYDPYMMTVRQPVQGSFPTPLTDYPGAAVSPLIDHDQSILFPIRSGKLIKLDQNLQEVWVLDGYADQAPILCNDGSIFAVSNDHKNPVIRNLNPDGSLAFEITEQLEDPFGRQATYPEEHDTALPLIRLALSRTGELYAASRNGKIHAFKAPAPLSTADWPKLYGGYENALRVSSTPPEIVTQPVGGDFISGEIRQLAVIARGRPTPSFQWYHNGEAIPDATSSLLDIGALGYSERGDYHVVLESTQGMVKSDTVSVTMRHRLETKVEGLGSATAEPSQEIYEHETPVTLTAVPAPGFEFGGWTGGIESGENPVEIVMDFSKLIIAKMTDISVPELTVNESFPATSEVPEFQITGLVGDNSAIRSLSYILNDGEETAIDFAEFAYSLTVPLELGENSLTLIALDDSGLETKTTQVISWEPKHSWSVEAPESVDEAEVFSAKVFLTSGGDVAGAKITLASNPVSLSYLGFEPGEALEGTFQTLSEENGVVSLTFASLDEPVPAGKTMIGKITYRLRSLPLTQSEELSISQIDLADINGSPFLARSGIKNATIELNPRELPGDVNNNGKYDVGDAQHLQRLLGGLEKMRPWDSDLNDVNRSGNFEIGDVIVVLQTAAGRLDQPGTPDQQGKGKPIPVDYHPDAPRARIILEPAFAPAGTEVTAKVVVDRVSADFGGTSFTLHYPAEALRLANKDAHRLGELQPASTLAVWNLAPSQNDYPNQNGTISFAAGSAQDWPNSGEGGIIAEFVFTVQEAADTRDFWQLEITESEVSTDDGLVIEQCRPGQATFIGQALTWSVWQTENFSAAEMSEPEISGEFADPDQDGYTNQFEYFFGLDPNKPSSKNPLHPVWAETWDGKIHFGLEINHDARAVDLKPELEWSRDLLNWHANDPGGLTKWWEKVDGSDQEPDPGKFILMDLREQAAPVFLRIRLR